MKLKLFKYCCALLIGIALVCISLFDNVHYVSFREKAFVMGAGLIIIALGVYRITVLLKSSSLSEKQSK